MKIIYVFASLLSLPVGAYAVTPIPNQAVAPPSGVPNVPANANGAAAAYGQPPIPNNAVVNGQRVPGDPRATAPLVPGNNTNGTTVNGQFVPRPYGDTANPTATATGTNTNMNTDPPAGYR